MRIGLVLNILDEQYQISVYNGIKKRAAELGIDLICYQQEGRKFEEDTFLHSFPEKTVFNLDGVILLTSVISDNSELNNRDDIKKIWGDIPVVSVGQKIKDIPSLLINTDSSMHQLVEHLIVDHGYKKFLFISGASNHSDAILREKKFIETIDEYKEKGFDLKYTLKRGWFVEQAAIQVMKTYYEENHDEQPDVIVCANDNMAIGVYKFFKMNLHNSAIKECAVTGFDDIPQGRFEIPSLTTIRQPLDEIGIKAVDELFDLISGKQIEENTYVESKVVLRKSCGCTYVENGESQEKYYGEMQTNYVQSERLLRMVSHIGQDLNYGETDLGLRYVLNVNMEQLEIQNFCVLNFVERVTGYNNIHEKLIKPVYVRKNGRFFYEFSNNKNMTIGDFYNKFLDYDKEAPQTLAFRFLRYSTDIVGCILYDASPAVMPYICSISVNISQSLNRVSVTEERKKYSEYLEKEVAERTKELLEANNRRLEVEAEILRISELERQRFSNDLHDDICQRLAGISMLCRSYSNQNKAVTKEQMVELAELINDTLQTTRQYAHNSFPVELESLGMKNSISNLCNSFEKQAGIKCEYNWSLKNDSIFDKTEKLNIFRIIQEALHNILKHAKATAVCVSLSEVNNVVTVSISDNGCGIIKKDSESDKGLGLNSMQYRANQIGAAFTIKENKPQGTIVQLELNKN